MSFRPLLFMTLLLFYACQPLAQESLFVGLPRSASEEVMSLVDGTGEEARFEAIRQLETDSKGNLYVYDVGKEESTRRSNDDIYTYSSIRRITSEGLVTTLIGQGVGQDLIGFANRGFAIRNDILYTASAGCLLKADLNQPVIAFEVFYGKCLSATDLARLIQQAKEQGFPIPIEEAFGNVEFYHIQPDSEVYFLARAIPFGRSLEFKIALQEEVVDVSMPGLTLIRGDINSYAVDSKGWLYSIVSGDPGPGPPGPTNLVKTKFTRPFDDSVPISKIVYDNELDHPSIPVIDSADYLYFFDGGIVKMIKPDESVQNIARLFEGAEKAGEKKTFTFGAVVNPQRTFLYFAKATAIYRIPLPIFKETSHE